MDYANAEVVVFEKTEFEAMEINMHHLSDLQLLIVGGGVGEVIIG
jgi:hypothetical protein